MKTPGQVGYEAMLELMVAREPRPLEPGDAEVRALVRPWEVQAQVLKDDWEHVAAKILEAKYA